MTKENTENDIEDVLAVSKQTIALYTYIKENELDVFRKNNLIQQVSSTHNCYIQGWLTIQKYKQFLDDFKLDN